MESKYMAESQSILGIYANGLWEICKFPKQNSPLLGRNLGGW